MTLNLETIDKDCNALNVLFEAIISDMKNSPPLWEDFTNKASKLQTQLKSTLFASNSFLESFQKIADLATNNTNGVTKDIGALLTRLCIRHRAIETKFKQFTCSLSECLVQPLNEKLEEWKKTVVNLDKEHNKEYKKLRIELKKKATDTLRLQKKLIKKNQQFQQQQQQHQTMNLNVNSLNELRYKYENSLKEVNDYYTLLEETEKQHLRLVMIEERNHFCTFFKLIKPIIDIEMSMIDEVTHMEDIVSTLSKNTNEPHLLPNSMSVMLDQMIKDLKGSPNLISTLTQNSSSNNSSNGNSLNSPPSSPSSLGSRKSSVCSINSLTSSSSSSSHSRSPGHLKFRLAAQQHLIGINRLSSVSSQDSGFTSQEQFFLKPPHLLDDKESIEYKMAIACGTMKAGWMTSKMSNGSSTNGFNIQTHHLHGNGGLVVENSIQQQTQIINNNAAQAMTSNNNDCMLARHTVAGLPLLISNNNESNSQLIHKTRPALSIHTFDPPEQQHQLSNNTEIKSNNSPVIYAPPVLVKETINLDSPNKFTNINKSSPTSNVLNNRLAPQMLVNSNNNNSTQQYLSHQRQRSTTLPPEVIADGLKELTAIKNQLHSPSKYNNVSQGTTTINSTLSGISCCNGSSDTLLEEEIVTKTSNQQKILNSNNQEQQQQVESKNYSKQGLNRNPSCVSNMSKPTPPIRRNSSISATHNSYLYNQQQRLNNNEVYIENNYDDIQNIQKYNINVTSSTTILSHALSPQPPPPPPPPPLPTINFIHKQQQQQHNDSYECLPPPPLSFFTDEIIEHNNVKPSTTKILNNTNQMKNQTTQNSINCNNNTKATSSHQVLMSQIQFGVKLKPVRSHNKI